MRGLDYYTGLVFRVFAPDLGFEVGGGGRYDTLLGRFGRPLPAVGFMLGLDRVALLLERQGGRRRPPRPRRRRSTAATSARALARARERREAGRARALRQRGGRGEPHDRALEGQAAAAGRRRSSAARACPSRTATAAGSSSPTGDLRFLFVKDMDVPTYVEYGVADCGIAGRDVLLETGADVLEPLDLGFGRCRLVVAGPAGPGFAPDRAVDRARRDQVREGDRRALPRAAASAVEVVKLAGSVEIAPGLGLADCIVDVVETGRTLARERPRGDRDRGRVLGPPRS